MPLIEDLQRQKACAIHTRACVTKGGREEYMVVGGNGSGLLIVVKLSYSSCWGFGGAKGPIFGFQHVRHSPHAAARATVRSGWGGRMVCI